MSRRNGFTLIELMLAVFILAVIMTIVYGVVVSTIQAQERVEEILLASEIGPAILSQIRDELESAIVPKETGEYFLGIDRKGSTGDRDRIDFVTSRIAFGAERENDDPFFHSVNECGYQLQDNKRDATLGVLYRREDFWVDNEPLKGGRLIEMYDRVKHFNVMFWDGERWVHTWGAKDNKGKLPGAVKIELRILVTDRGDHTIEQSYTTTITYPQ